MTEITAQQVDEALADLRGSREWVPDYELPEWFDKSGIRHTTEDAGLDFRGKATPIRRNYFREGVVDRLLDMRIEMAVESETDGDTKELAEVSS